MKLNITNVVGNVKDVVNRVIDSINTNIIGKLKIGGFSVPKIPRLAQGGYVRANAPQLAMIGDNKRYGEIVAPENKMQDMINTALRQFQGQQSQKAETYTGDIVINLNGQQVLRKEIQAVLRQLKTQGVII